jgi:molecular chaperone GrpE
MSDRQRKTGPRKVEVTGPEERQAEADAKAAGDAAECPFIPGEDEQAPAVAESVGETASGKGDAAGRAQTAELEAAISELEDKCAYAEDQHLRIAAELQNYKRRVQKEKDQLIRYATDGLVTELIPVLDNFERAMEVEVDSPGAECLMAGVKMIYDQLQRVLEAQGVEPIEALGETFDPDLHEAVEREETNALPPDVIVSEIAKGYKMHQKVIRPSKVRVTVRPEPAAEADQTE